MIEIQRENDLFTISFLKSDIGEFLENLLKKLEIERLLAKNRMTDEQAWDLSEEIKENWWKDNQERILKMIGVNNESCHRYEHRFFCVIEEA
jgi:hypothetical protein